MNNIVINKCLFTAYCGMIASGYSLMDTSDPLVWEICDRLSKMEFGDDVRKYFSYAKTNQVAVNPWYPRGSDLSVACFFSNQCELLDFLRFCNSPNIDDPSFVEWIAHLSSVLNKIQSHKNFEITWKRYCIGIHDRFDSLSPEIEKLQKLLNRLPFGKDVRIVFAPNLLQSKYLADYALVVNILFIISGSFNASAVIHEYLHIAFHEYRQVIEDILQHRSIDEFVDRDKMLSLGYMQDFSLESAASALEDCIIRALSGVLDNDIDMSAYLTMNFESGFTSLPQMICNLQGLSLNEMTPENIIRKIIR